MKKVKQKSQSSLLREYTKAYLEGRVPEQYTIDSLVTFMGLYRGKVYDIPLPRHDELEAAVAASRKKFRNVQLVDSMQSTEAIHARTFQLNRPASDWSVQTDVQGRTFGRIPFPLDVRQREREITHPPCDAAKRACAAQSS